MNGVLAFVELGAVGLGAVSLDAVALHAVTLHAVTLRASQTALGVFRRLQVTMHNSILMRELYRMADFNHEMQPLLRG